MTKLKPHKKGHRDTLFSINAKNAMLLSVTFFSNVISVSLPTSLIYISFIYDNPSPFFFRRVLMATSLALKGYIFWL